MPRTGWAVRLADAARRLRAAILTTAAEMLGCSPIALTLTESAVQVVSDATRAKRRSTLPPVAERVLAAMRAAT